MLANTKTVRQAIRYAADDCMTEVRGRTYTDKEKGKDSKLRYVAVQLTAAHATGKYEAVAKRATERLAMQGYTDSKVQYVGWFLRCKAVMVDLDAVCAIMYTLQLNTQRSKHAST